MIIIFNYEIFIDIIASKSLYGLSSIAKMTAAYQHTISVDKIDNVIIVNNVKPFAMRRTARK